MPEYERLYHIMFNAATDALKHIEAEDYDQAKSILTAAQVKAEGIYIKQPDEDSR